MGNACATACATCHSVQEGGDTTLNVDFADEYYGEFQPAEVGAGVSVLLTEKIEDSSLPRLIGNQQNHYWTGWNKPSPGEASSASDKASSGKNRPNLPPLNLFKSEDARKEKEAFAKIDAISHDISSGTDITDFSATPTPIPRKQELSLRQIAESAPCVELAFDVQGHHKTLQLYKRPLGAEFSKKSSSAETRVTKVYPQSYAWGIGLEVGWVLKEVNGEDVAGLTFEEVQRLLQEALTALPLRSRD